MNKGNLMRHYLIAVITGLLVMCSLRLQSMSVSGFASLMFEGHISNNTLDPISNHSRSAPSSPASPAAAADTPTANGAIVLGMHRSGTSMLTGVLAAAFHFWLGNDDELIPPRRYNRKGYFERIDVVVQNDKILKREGVHLFDEKGIQAYMLRNASSWSNELLENKFSVTARNFFNHRNNTPWLQKDPRMVVTLREWLPHIQTRPAIIFIYRHPLHVAKSLLKRDKTPLEKGLMLWTEYNKAMFKNTQGLCVVTTSNTVILKDPIPELNRIVQELIQMCGLKPPPQTQAHEENVTDFIDLNLQHHQPFLEQQDECTETHLKELSASSALNDAMELYCRILNGSIFQFNQTTTLR